MVSVGRPSNKPFNEFDSLREIDTVLLTHKDTAAQDGNDVYKLQIFGWLGKGNHSQLPISRGYSYERKHYFHGKNAYAQACGFIEALSVFSGKRLRCQGKEGDFQILWYSDEAEKRNKPLDLKLQLIPK